MSLFVSRRGHQPNGFTLIEVLVTVVIIGILATIAYPSYLDYVRKSRRTDAKNTLLELANRQEQFFANRGRYAATLTDIWNQTDSIDGYYTVSIEAATESCPITRCYSLRATPVAGKSQASDAVCSWFRLRSDGRREASNEVCWQ
ncbi:type IV pilin protein [Tepidimonas thermarum]|uniref:type IV pilin protein n=1 Tax=Tepidimonas thermarum TaxID=335431 RepID=UPI00163DCAA7